MITNFDISSPIILKNKKKKVKGKSQHIEVG